MHKLNLQPQICYGIIRSDLHEASKTQTISLTITRALMQHGNVCARLADIQFVEAVILVYFPITSTQVIFKSWAVCLTCAMCFRST